MSSEQTYYLLQLGVPTGTGTSPVVIDATVDSPPNLLDGGAYSVNVNNGQYSAHYSETDMFFGLPPGSWGTMNGAFSSGVTDTITGTMTLQTALPVNVKLSFISFGSRTLIQTLPAGSTKIDFSYTPPSGVRGLTQEELIGYFVAIAQEVAAA
jgi:hypothetical protein